MADDHDDHGHEVEHAEGYPPGETRVTAPQQDYTSGQVGAGALVALVGLAVVFGVPLLV
jgi:hypothetical protein